VWVGASAASWRERANRRHQFIERQLQEFYSPMVGLGKEIEARLSLLQGLANGSLETVDEHRKHIDTIIARQKELSDATQVLLSQAKQRLEAGESAGDQIATAAEKIAMLHNNLDELRASERRAQEYGKLPALLDDRLLDIRPLLEESARIFRDRYWLAEESTRSHFVRFNQRVEHVRVRRPDLAVSDLVDLDKHFAHTGGATETFLEDLARHLGALRSRLAGR
jgi:hypothetical protein